MISIMDRLLDGTQKVESKTSGRVGLRNMAFPCQMNRERSMLIASASSSMVPLAALAEWGQTPTITDLRNGQIEEDNDGSWNYVLF